MECESAEWSCEHAQAAAEAGFGEADEEDSQRGEKDGGERRFHCDAEFVGGMRWTRNAFQSARMQLLRMGAFGKVETMAATVEISLPDSLVKALGAELSELPRRASEALVADSYRSGRLSHAQVAEVLEFDRWETDAFLKSREAHRPWDPAEFAGDVETLRNIANQ